MFGVATIVGPLIGGFFTDLGTVSLGGFAIAGWRWIFYVNAPLALIALAVLQQRSLFAAARPAAAGPPEKIDFAGALLVVATFLPLLLALSWGGHQHAWSSPRVVGLFVLAAINFVLLMLVERGRPNAIIALPLYRDPVFRRCNAALFVLNLGFLGILTFLPLFIQTTLQGNATESGLIMVPLMGGMIAASIVSGRIAARTHRYKPGMIGGGVLVLIGLVLLMRVDVGTTHLELSALMVVIGAGLGPSQSLFTLAIQSAVAPEHVGAATSASQFSRQMGATIGVAVFGALLTANLTAELRRSTPELTAGSSGTVDIDLAQKLVVDHALLRSTIAAQAAPAPPAPDAFDRVQLKLRDAFARAITSLFLAGAAIALLALLIMLRVPDRPLRGREQSAEQTPLEPIH